MHNVVKMLSTENEVLKYLEYAGISSIKLAENLCGFIRNGLAIEATKKGFDTFMECDGEMLCVGSYTLSDLKGGDIYVE